MTEEKPEINKGRAIRVEHRFVIRYREPKPNVSHEWDITSVKNISNSGVSFKVSRFYKPGSELELKLKNPKIGEESTLWTKVLRCNDTDANGVYEVAATIIDVEEETRHAFDKTIEFFIKQEGREC